MCEKSADEPTNKPYQVPYDNQTAGQALRTESHLVYELKQKREYLFRQLLTIQQAIDAVNLTNNL